MRSLPHQVSIVFLALVIGTLPGCIEIAPLADAASQGDSHRVRTLLDQGEREGMESAFFNAACEGNTEVAQLLLEKGARVDSIFVDGGYNALHCAVYKDHPEKVSLLLKYGATPDKRALQIAYQEGNASIVQLLMEAQSSLTMRPPQRPAPHPPSASPPPLIY